MSREAGLFLDFPDDEEDEEEATSMDVFADDLFDGLEEDEGED